MTGTDLCVRLYKSVSVIFEPPCTNTASGDIYLALPSVLRHLLSMSCDIYS